MADVEPGSAAEASLEEMLSTRLSVDSVKIQGAALTSPDLLSYVTAPVLSTGGTFAGVVDDISLAIERLRATGCFRGVDAYVDRSPAGGDATVLFTVAERGLYKLHTGTFVETRDDRDATLEAALVWRNVRGRADTLKASLNWLGGGRPASFGADPSTAAELSYVAPFALGLRTAAFATLAQSARSHAAESSYKLRVRRAEAGLDTPLGRFALASAWREVADVAPDASPLVREEAGHSWKTSVRHEVAHDARDHAPMPTAGVYAAARSEAALPVLGNVAFVKGEAEGQLHVPLGASGAAIALASRAGLVTARGEGRVRVQDRFFLGGANSLRGFEPRGMGPRDAQDAVGGEAFYTATAMFSTPVPQASLLWQLFNARMHAYGTVGDLTDTAVLGRNVRRLTNRENGSTLGQAAKSVWKDMYSSMRVSLGLGIALETSVGRVEVNFCHVVRAAESDRPKTGIQLGISESFS